VKGAEADLHEDGTIEIDNGKVVVEEEAFGGRKSAEMTMSATAERRGWSVVTGRDQGHQDETAIANKIDDQTRRAQVWRTNSGFKRNSASRH
jgi:predicted double-glycine peptidase